MSLRRTTRTRAAATTVAVVAGAVLAAGLAPTTGPAAGATAQPDTVTPALDITADPKADFGVDQVTQILTQPDGFEFKARMTDLKVGGLFETLGGYGVERDGDRVWRYITGLNAKGKPALGEVVTDAAPPKGLAKHLGRRQVDLSDPELATRELIGKQLRSIAGKLEQDPGTADRAAGPRVFYVPALMLAT